MTRQEIKIWAKGKIKENFWPLLGTIVAASLIGGITSSIKIDSTVGSFTLSIGGGILTFFMEIGLIKYMTAFINNKPYNFDMIFSKFKDWKQTIIVYLHQFAMILLWTLLLIVPGIIKAYAYSLVTYILAEDSSISSKDALELSEKMMDGHKGDLFVFELSFIGWHILSILTLGILYIWLIPYQQTATTKFLLDIKEEYEKNNKTQKVN